MRVPTAAVCLLAATALLQARSEQVADTTFSIDRGFHDGPITVRVASATPGAFIAYTTDGSAPTPGGGQSSPVDIQIDRSTPLRALAYLPGGGMEPTDVDTQTYIILSDPMRWSGKSYTTSSAYPAGVVTSLESLPSLFIAMRPADFATVRDSGSGGIGQSGANEQYERPCSAELWYPPNSRFAGFEGFQVDAGLRPHSWVTTKRAFRLYFKRQYGAGKLRYPIFESAPWAGESAVEEFDKLVLRHHSNDGWEGRWGGADEALYLRDQFARACQIDMGGLGSRSLWAHLFVNGAYYGLYSPCERPDDDFLASYLGGDDADYLGFNHGGVINDGADDTIYQAYRNPGDLSGAAAYVAFQSVLDPAQFSDYLISSWFNTTHSHDWPVNGTRPQNFYGGNRNSPAGATRHFTWDFEASLVWDSAVHEKFRRGSPDAGREFIRTWFALVDNDDFMQLFADRAYRHLFNGGALTQHRSLQRLNAMAAHVQPALEAEKWQWGSGHDNWLSQIAAARAKLTTNQANLVASLRSQAYYPTNDPPSILSGGQPVLVDRLRVPPGATITLSNPNGTTGSIRYTLDGSDPRGAGSQDGGDLQQITITAPTVIRCRVQDGANWSALRELQVMVPQDFSGLRISEVMYHPAPEPASSAVSILNIVGDADLGRARIDLAAAPPAALRDGDLIRIAGGLPANEGLFEIARAEGNSLYLRATLSDDPSMTAVADLLYDGDRYEFIEIENSGATPLDLGAVEFTKGVAFAFAPGYSLAAGERAVVANRPGDFAGRYPSVPIAGEFLRDLDNGGEKVEIAQTDATLHDVTSLSAGGVITFNSLPAGASVGNRIRITGCERVTNNGSYLIRTVAANSVTVNKQFVDAPAGGYAQIFEVIDSVDYDDRDGWPRAADGLGFSLALEAGSWRASAATGGSPGAGDPAPPTHPGLLVNEVLTHTDLPQFDTIEIHNPTGAPVSLAGWTLTDDLDEPAKFQIATGTVAAAGYQVFDEDDFGAAFRLGSGGDSVYLLSPDLRYAHGFNFGAAENGVSFGRHVTSTGAEHLVRQSANSFGAANHGPRTGPVVISEIFYHPPDGSFEFLELTNISASPVDLSGWTVGGIGFTFPAGVSLAPGEVMLLAQHPSAAPGAPAGTQRLIYSGRLSNGGERLRLRTPEEITIDEVSFDDTAPWPSTPDGSGPSLERIANTAYADDPVNWRASSASGGTPGASEPPTTPLIAFEPATISASTLEGSTPAADTFEIWNSGIGTLDYDLSEDEAWLALSPGNGSSTNSAARQTHTLNFASAALAPGIYRGEVTVTAPAANSPTTIPITLTVRERDTTPPEITTTTATSGSSVSVVFSEPVADGAGTASNYTLDGGVSVLAATVNPDQASVQLITTPMTPGTAYALSVSGVSDQADIPNQISAGASSSFFYAGNPLPEDLVAHWRFDEGSGNIAADDESGNTLTLQQSPGWVPGQDAGAISLDGSAQYGSRGDSQLVGAFPSMSVGGATEFTLAAWIRLNRTGHRHAIMTKQGNETRGLLWSVESNNRLSLELFKNQSDDTDIASDTTLAAGRWYHVAVSYRFITDGTSRVRLYIDGTPSGGSDSVVGPPAANGLDINIGRYWWSSGYSTYFDGSIDDFMVFDRELGPDEITQLQSGALPTTSTPQINPPGGDFVSPVEVSITSATDGAQIYYTVDGSEPTVASEPYATPFTVAQTTTVRARAFAAGKLPSDSGSATFTRVETSGDWWNTALGFRRLISVNAAGYPRKDLHCAVIPIDLSTAVPESIRVVEINHLGAVIDSGVAFQYDPADGELVVALHGDTAATASRWYHVYYATSGTFSPPATTPLVVVDPDSSDGGFGSIRAVTPSGTWQYHKTGAGFSSLDDIDGNDWIGWSTANGSDGAYRGIPNLAFNSGYFHPGGEGNPSTTTLASDGPVRSTLTSLSEDGKWELRWDIYPAYAQMDVVRRDPDETYWFLYEGTPGGAIDLDSDYSVRPDGTRLPLGTSWTGDLPGQEWVYVEDSVLDRSIYLIQHEPDNHTDSYWQLNGDMTVLGFGRLNLNTYLTAAPNRYTVGLADDASFANMEQVIESAYRPMTISSGLAEPIPAAARYLAWARQQFGEAAVNNPALEDTLWGLYSDPDGDGLTNALEQVTASNPLASDATDAFSIAADGDSGELLFRYRLATDTQGWQVTAQSSEDLSRWVPLAGVPRLHADLGHAIIWELPLPSSPKRIFGRLEVRE